MGIVTYSKLHKVVIVFCEHVQEEISHLELPQVLHVLRIVGKVGQVGKNLLLCLWKHICKCQEKYTNLNEIIHTT